MEMEPVLNCTRGNGSSTTVSNPPTQVSTTPKRKESIVNMASQCEAIKPGTKVIQISDSRRFISRPLRVDQVALLPSPSHNSKIPPTRSNDLLSSKVFFQPYTNIRQDARRRIPQTSYTPMSISQNSYSSSFNWTHPIGKQLLHEKFNYSTQQSYDLVADENNQLMYTTDNKKIPQKKINLKQLLGCNRSRVCNQFGSKSMRYYNYREQQQHPNMPLALRSILNNEMPHTLKSQCCNITEPANLENSAVGLSGSHYGNQFVNKLEDSSIFHLKQNFIGPKQVSSSCIQPSTFSHIGGNKTVGSGLQWLFDAVAFNEASISPMIESKSLPHIAEPLVYNNRNPFFLQKHELSSTNSLPNDTHINPWNFSFPEDLVDDEYLFRRDEVIRRKNPRYLNKTKHLHDLHIVMPLCIPYGKIIVEDPLGANYYSFSPEYPGAHLLFGKGVAHHPSYVNTNDKKHRSLSPINHLKQEVLSNNETNNKENNDMNDYKENHLFKSQQLYSEKNDLTSSSLSCSNQYHDFNNFQKDNQLLSNTHLNTNIISTSSQPIDDKIKIISPACDVWASFLHVRFGTIYNLTEDQMAIVVNYFRCSFDEDLCRFYVPISLDCRGVYPSTDELISQRAIRPSLLLRDAKEGKRTAGERYETRGVPTTTNDIKRLRMLTRHLKRFAFQLINELGFNNQQQSNNTVQSVNNYGLDDIVPYPMPCIELHNNCRTDTLIGGQVKIMIREWSPLADPELFKKVWNGRLSSPLSSPGVVDEIRSKLLFNKEDVPSAKVLLGEIRLEHNHLRMVDPRWPEELLLGRRIADYHLSNTESGSSYSQARFIFCSRISNPNITYAYAPIGGDPRDAALKSRLKELFMMHLSRYPTAGVRMLHTDNTTVPIQIKDGSILSNDTTPRASIRDQTDNGRGGEVESAEKKEKPEDSERGGRQIILPKSSVNIFANMKELPEAFIPMKHRPDISSHPVFGTKPSYSQQYILRTTDTLVSQTDRSALKPDVTFHVPLTTVACKFFSTGGCARANDCYFLHPADPILESKVDVRHIVPKHPKFF